MLGLVLGTATHCSLVVDTKGLVGIASADGGTGGVADATPPDGADADGPALVDAGGSRYAEAVLGDRPIAYWRMGTRLGDAVPDATGRGNDLILHGAVTLAQGALAGDPDGAMAFDGTTGYGLATASDRLFFEGKKPFSLECWVRRLPRAGAGSYEHLLGNSKGSGDLRTGYILYLSLGSVQQSGFEWTSPGGRHLARASLPTPSVFVHYAATFDGTRLSLFVDGKAEAATVVAGEQVAQPSELVVAADHGGTEAFFSGVIDEVAVYDRALPQMDIVRHRDLGY